MAKEVDRGLENREIVLSVLTEVLEKGAFIHLVLNQALYKYQYLSKADRGFITRTAEGTIEYLLQIDEVINRYSKTRTGRMKAVIRNILRLSVYQILYMDRVPDSAVCNEAVRLAAKHKFHGLKGFVNGVLRTISREKEQISFQDPVLKYSIPGWLFERWEKELGRERAEAVCASFLKERPTWIRCNLARASREEILDSLKSQGVLAEPLEGFPSMLALREYDHLEGLEAFQMGLIQVQDVSSAFVGELAAPKEGNQILDVCAAPGGKSLHAADKMNGTGMVTARDLTRAKADLICENVDRCGMDNIQVEVWDALEYDPSWEGKADIVIADLPCSGLGIIGRKPDIKYNIQPEDLEELAKLQREILSVVWKYVKPGGRLVYSTCTINPLENENNADWILEQLPFEAVDLRGVSAACPQEASLEQGRIQFLPGIHPYDGFFISVFRRKESVPC